MKKILIPIMIICLTQFLFAKTTIRLIAPKVAASGEKVPMGVEVSPSLKAGDEMSFLFDNNLIATMSSDGKFRYSKFRTKIRMTKSGYLSVRIHKANGEKLSKRKYVKVKKPAKKISRSPNAKNGKVAVKGNTLKSVVRGYANQVLVKTKSGSLLFKPTQYISKQIFFAVTGNNNYRGAVIKIPSKTITLSPYPRTYNPEADRAAAGLLFAGLKWIYGGSGTSSTRSTSSSSSIKYVMVQAECINGLIPCIEKNLKITGSPGRFEPSYGGANSGTIYKGYNNKIAGRYSFTVTFDKSLCSGSFYLSGTKKNYSINLSKECSENGSREW